MDKRFLSKITKNINHSDSQIAKLRELIDLEIKSLDATELSNKQIVLDFLNSLPSDHGEYVQFIQNHFVYFLLKNCTLGEIHPLTVHSDKVDEKIVLMTRICEVMANISCDMFQCESTGPLSNKNVIMDLQYFLESIPSSQPLVNIAVKDNPIKTFLCVEEIIASFYIAKWNSTPILPIEIQHYSDMSTLEQWTITLYVTSINVKHNLENDIHSVSQLASRLVLEQQDLFVFPTTNTESILSFPFAKTRAKLIFQSYIGDMDSDITDSGPILCIRDKDLKSISTDYFFLYDYIFEALSNNQSYNCSDSIIEDFIDRAVHSLTDLSEKLISASKMVDSQDVIIERFRNYLIQYGLTDKNCTNFTTIMSLNSSQKLPKWEGFESLLEIVHQLTLLGHYFYMCLGQFSPTSLGFNKIMDTLKLAATEQQPITTWRHMAISTSYFKWNISQMLHFFIPQPPMLTIGKISKGITSEYMRALFWISMKRMWNIKKQHQDVMLLNPPFESQNISEDEVAKYCQQLEIGDGSYNVHIVRNTNFYKKFIELKAYPILQKIFSNGLQKNRSIFHLRWLITFAAEDTVNLQPLRRPLIMLYFQINDIMLHGKFENPFINILDYTQEILEAIRECIPNATLDSDLITYLFLVHYSPSFNILQITIKEFIQETCSIVEGINSLIRVGAAFCHSEFKYDVTSDTIGLNLKDTNKPFIVSLETFKTIVISLRQNCYELIIMLNKLSQELHASYLDLLTIMGEIEMLSKHTIKFDVHGLDFNIVNAHFIKCFTIYHNITNKVIDSCCYSLTKRFSELFESDLIPTEIIDKILNFKEDTDDPSLLLSGLYQPISQNTSNAPKDMHIPVMPYETNPHQGIQLSKNDIESIRDLVPEFKDMSKKTENRNETMPIKHNFSDSFNNVNIQVNWSMFKRLVYIPSSQKQKFSIIFKSNILDAFEK